MNQLFNSPIDYFRFACAKDFYQPGAGQFFDHQPNRLERFGDKMLKPFTLASDSTLKNIRKPAVLSSITIVALALTALAFYPSQLLQTIRRVVPFLFELQYIRFGFYTVIQYNILALGIRTLGRLSNHDSLLPAWTQGKIVPIQVGSTLK